MPKSTFHHGRKYEFPLFQLVHVGLDRMNIVLGGQTLPDVLSIDHIFPVKGNDER